MGAIHISGFWVYDDEPELSEETPGGPKLYGKDGADTAWGGAIPFDTAADAAEYANELHPDDASGDAVVVTLTAKVVSD